MQFRAIRGETFFDKNSFKTFYWDFFDGAVSKNPLADTGDVGSVLVQGDPTCCMAAKPVHRNS